MMRTMLLLSSTALALAACAPTRPAGPLPPRAIVQLIGGAQFEVQQLPSGGLQISRPHGRMENWEGYVARGAADVYCGGRSAHSIYDRYIVNGTWLIVRGCGA